MSYYKELNPIKSHKPLNTLSYEVCDRFNTLDMYYHKVSDH